MRVCFSAIPAFGHVFPMAPLAAAAAAQGHEVTFVASVEFRERLPVRVLQGVPEGLTLSQAEAEAGREIVERADPLAWPRAMFGVVMPRHIVPRLLEHWGREGAPDLVIHEAYNVGAAVAAARAGVPAVSFNVGLTPLGAFFDVLADMAGVEASTMLDPRPPSWRSHTESGSELIPIRPVAWSDPTTGLPDGFREAGQGTRAYVTFGTVVFGATLPFRRAILEAADVCTRVLVATGPESDVAALGDLPANVQVVRYVDQAAALGCADVAVHHGGTGTTLACLAAGVPQLITPQGTDQFANADRLEVLGQGCQVGNDAQEGAVREAVTRLLHDSDLRSAVRGVRDEIAAMPAPGEVVQVLAERFAT